MKQDVAEKWVKALRSGEYQQTVHVLYDGVGYCCLGVLCKVLNREFEKNENGEFSVTNEQWYYGSILPDSVRKIADMYNEFGDVRDHGYLAEGKLFDHRTMFHTLTSLNDNGFDFKQIADVIEKNWERL